MTTIRNDLWIAPELDQNDDPYLNGQYAPVRDERNDPDLPVIGELPDGLAGVYMRNGGNPFFTPPGRYHVFDGDGMVHGLYLDGDGSATYANRWIRSGGLRVERERGRAVYGGLSEFTLPDDEAMAAGGIFKNTANTNIVSHADRYLALMEGARIGVLSRSSEDTVWIDVDPFYTFHFMNAWEDPSGSIIVDGCRAAAMPIAFGDDPPPDKDVRPYLWRWEIDPVAQVVKDTQLYDRPGDFPRINKSRTGRPYRYGTHAHTRDWGSEGVEFDGVIQFDHHTGTEAIHVYGPTHVCGDPDALRRSCLL